MKQTAIICITIICVALLLVGTATAKDHKDLEHGPTYTKEIVVSGNRAWVNTGITLNPGDTVTIAAKGTVYFNEDHSISKVSPQGYDRNFYEIDFLLDDAAHCFDPQKLLSHAALIGDIGGEMFYVGPQKVVAKKVGILSLGINDCSLSGMGRFDNSGQFTVKITVHVNKKPLKP